MAFQQSIQIVVDSTGAVRNVNNLSKSMDNLGDETKETQKEFKLFTGGFSGFKVGALAVAAVVAASAKTIAEVTIETEKYHAILKTATGSTSEAATQFDRLNEFAAQTPFTLKESVEGFVQLKNLGLDPSEESMGSFANTAAATGKSLSQMIEAVADATTNEFERLKEFGIKSKQEGENVTFTFQGVETTVKKSSENIQQYLIDIGNTQFAGAVADQMDTVAGRATSVQQHFDDLTRAIGESAGAADIMKIALEFVDAVLIGIKDSLPFIVADFQNLDDVIRGRLAQGISFAVQQLEEFGIRLDNVFESQELVNIKLEESALKHERLRKFIDDDLTSQQAFTVSTNDAIEAQNKANQATQDAIDKAAKQAEALDKTTESVDKQEKALTSLIDKLFPAEAQAKKLKEQEQLLQGALENGTITWSRYADALNRLKPIEDGQIVALDDQLISVEKLSGAYDGLTASVQKSDDAVTASAASSITVNQTREDVIRNINNATVGSVFDDPLGTFDRSQRQSELASIEQRHQASLRFAQGGSFTVGGRGGIDSETVSFKATPGETVSIDKKQADSGTVNNNAGGPVTIIMNGVQDVQGFAKRLAEHTRTNPLPLNISNRGVIPG